MKVKGLFYRDVAIDRKMVDEEARTVDLSFSSETGVPRSMLVDGVWREGQEVLDHTPKAANFERLNNGAALLVNHNPDNHVGVVESAAIKDKRGVAKVRFGRSDEADKVFTDVKDGIRRGVSIGYRVHKIAYEEADEKLDTFRVTSWEPFEVSVVSVPADPTIGVGRGAETEYEVQIERSSSMDPKEQNTPPTPQPPASPPVDLEAEREKIRAQVAADYNKRHQALDIAIERSKNPKVIELAKQFKTNDRSLEEFHREVTNIISEGPPEPIKTEDPSIGMDRKDIEQYSLVRAINSCVDNKTSKPGGFEGELSDEVAKRAGKPNGFFIPWDVQVDKDGVHARQRLMRQLQVGTFTAGGAFVQVNDGGQSMIELLRNNMVAVQAGATVLGGLTGDVDVPKQTGGATASWLAETAALTRTNQTTGQLALRPHRLASSTAFTKQLLNQSSVDIENFVRNDLMAVIAIAKDLAAFRGSGVSGQPLGIINTSNLSTAATHTSGGTFTWGQALDYETQVEESNANMGRLAYVMRPVDKAIAKATVRDSGGGGFVWDNGNQINGYPAFSTNQLTSGAGGTLFGNFADLIIADWDGMDVVVDPYSLSLNNQVSIVITTMTDIGLRHPESFSISVA